MPGQEGSKIKEEDIPEAQKEEDEDHAPLAGLDGLETAKRIRAADRDMTIIFFTNYIQYALEGYEVQAYRFLLKPLSYDQFSAVVGKARIELLARRKAMLVVRIKTKTSRTRQQLSKNGMFDTTKEERDLHGYGLLIIRRIVKQISGKFHAPVVQMDLSPRLHITVHSELVGSVSARWVDPLGVLGLVGGTSCQRQADTSKADNFFFIPVSPF